MEEVTKPIKKQKTPRTPKTAIAEAVLGYSSQTTAHGISYASCDGPGHVSEKILWTVICLAFSCLAIFLTWNAYMDWQLNPVITTILTTGTF